MGDTRDRIPKPAPSGAPSLADQRRHSERPYSSTITLGYLSTMTYRIKLRSELRVNGYIPWSYFKGKLE